MNGRKIQRIAAVLLTVLLLCYVGYQIYLANHRGIVTELAMYGTVSDTVQARGYLIREESVVDASYSGVLSYRVADGTRVAKDGVIADVFSSERDASVQNQIAQLDREIDIMEELSRPTDLFSVTPAMAGTQINMTMNQLLAQVRDNDFSRFEELKKDLLSALNRRQMLMGDEMAGEYSQRIVELTQQRNALASSAGNAIGSVTAPKAGYFVSTVDGLESAAVSEEAAHLTAEQVKALLALEPSASAGVGKICSGFNWYIACVIPDADMWHFEGVEDVEFTIPAASSAVIPGKIVAENRDAETGEVAMILECSYMDAGLASARNEDIAISVHTYSGVLVRESALRFRDIAYTETDENGNEVEKVAENVRGVYVLNGRQLEFVQVFTERTVNGYAICKTELSDTEQASLVTENTIRLYDNVVTEGTDLYDGKPV